MLEEKNILEELKKYFIDVYKEAAVTKQRPKLKTISEMATQYELTSPKIVEYLRTLENIGFLTRNLNKYYLAPSVVSSIQPVIPEQPLPIEEVPQQVVPEEPSPLEKQSADLLQELEEFRGRVEAPFEEEHQLLSTDFSPMTVSFLRIAMGIIGVAAAYMSIYYTWKWLLEFLPGFQAVILSGSVVAFSIIAFETMILFVKSKQKVLASCFGIVWLVVLVFSITSTVAGLYNKRVENYNQSIQQTYTSSYKAEEWGMYQQNERLILAQIKEKEGLLTTYTKRWTSAGSNPTNLDYQRMRTAQAELDMRRNELKQLNSTKLEFVKTQKDIGATKETSLKQKNFYQWLAQLFNIEADMMEFILSLFPAIFIDVIAPLSLAVFLFLTPKKHNSTL